MEEAMTADDVATFLKMSPYTIRAYARSGRIPAVKIGRQWRFNFNDVWEWFKSPGEEGIRNKRYPLTIIHNCKKCGGITTERFSSTRVIGHGPFICCDQEMEIQRIEK